MTRLPGVEARGFTLWSVLLLLILAVTTAFWYAKDPLTGLAVLYGGLISAGSSFSGYLLAVRADEITGTKFVKIFLGGMIARLSLALAALAAGIALLEFPPIPLVIACLASYFVFTLVEYLYLMPLLTAKAKPKIHD